MVVDAQGHFSTQRTLPRMAFDPPATQIPEMVLRAPGMLALHVALDVVEGSATVTVWDDTVPAWGWAPWRPSGSAIFWAAVPPGAF